MQVQFSFVGEAAMVRREQNEGDLYVDLVAVPREGEVVGIPGISQAHTVVRTVVWYPFGGDPDESDDPNSDPFVYVVLGNARPY